MMKKRLSRAIAFGVAVLVAIGSITPFSIDVKADSSGILGTNLALGSPVLNSNFAVEDWNPWEMEVWGLYLSNFCKPLIDTYETAFKTGGGGSNGAGYKAICFGSGSDSANNDLIRELCDEAIIYQKTVSKQIYVTYTHVGRDGIDGGKTTDANSAGANVRPATFDDLFFNSTTSLDSNKTNVYYKSGQFAAENKMVFIDSDNIKQYTDMYNMTTLDNGGAYVPTFWIKNNGGNGSRYIKILDLYDSWDAQMTALLATAFIRDDASSKKFKELYNENSKIVLDAFGNITTLDKIMVIPAAVNQNLTKEKKINLLNSWVFNGYSTSCSKESIVKYVRQDTTESFWKPGIFNIEIMSGLPALSGTGNGLDGTVFLYFDLDNGILNNYENNNTVNYRLSKDYGQILIDFYNAGISNPGKFPIKIGMAMKDGTFYDSKGLDNLKAHCLAVNWITNIPRDETYKQPEMLYKITTMDGTKIELFSTNNSDAAIVSDQLLPAGTGTEEKRADAARLFNNMIYELYCGVKGDTYLQNLVKDKIYYIKDYGKDGIRLTEEENTYRALASNSNKGVEKIKEFFNKEYKGYEYKFIAEPNDSDSNNSLRSDSARLIKVYPISDTMRSISEVLALRDGVQFNTYCTMIYATYLDEFGIGNSTILSHEPVSDFNPDIFDGESDILNFDIGDMSGTKTKEEKKDEILNLGYLMLHPDEGREYRKKLMLDGFEDFVYEQYNRIVYGGKNSAYSGTASKSNSGFLAVETFNDNVFTRWFLGSYTKIAMWLIIGSLVAIIIVGLITKRKISWFFINIVVAINVILLVPSSGEIVPYITSRFVQDMFSSKMTYWAISEGVTNAKIEEDTYVADETPESKIVAQLTKQLSIVNTDRSLMLKQDISQKLMPKTTGVYSQIQNIKSARWLLPMVMQQITGDDNTSEYLYVKLSNVWDDMSNLYWYYNPLDASNVSEITATSAQNVATENKSKGINSTTSADGTTEASYGYDTLTYGKIGSGNFNDFTSIDASNQTQRESQQYYNFRSYCYTLHQGANNEMVHLYAYTLDPFNTARYNLPSRTGILANYEDADSWQWYIDQCMNDKVNLAEYLKTRENTTSDSDSNERERLEEVMDEYDRTDRNTVHGDFSYLKMTENPIYYFFYVVKDSFESELAVDRVIARLQGGIGEDSEGNGVRASFMHATRTSTLALDQFDDYGIAERKEPGAGEFIEYTPYVRDIVDLENLFTNVIPYLYQMQLATGGFDGTSGVLEDREINSGSVYDGQLQSWIYRCNWATKIMENPELCEPEVVRYNTGREITLPNPLLPESYPSDRPMIFSEAEMVAYGLTERDLSMVELKCIEVNKDIADKWTLLVNYSGTPGLTKEVLYRQMATDATMIFNEQFSTDGLLNNKYKLYPQSLDLRYLSFDSVMKMLMLNVSRNTSYAYGNTMDTLVSDSDIFQAFLLLVDAALCAWAVPLFRSFLLAIIFFLGFAAIFRCMFNDGKQKAKVACGQFISNILFMLMTLAYYFIFTLLMSITSTEDVLSVKQMQTSAGNPTWVLIIVLLASLAYIIGMAYMIWFCAKNASDMCFEAYTMMAHTTMDKVTDSLSRATNNMKNALGGGDGETGGSGGTRTNGINGSGNKGEKAQSVKIKKNEDNNVDVKPSNEDDQKADKNDALSQNAFQSNTEAADAFEETTSDDINKEIEKGKEASESSSSASSTTPPTSPPANSN